MFQRVLVFTLKYYYIKYKNNLITDDITDDDIVSLSQALFDSGLIKLQNKKKLEKVA